MSDPNAGRGAAVWWLLLILPVALAIGWFAGRLDGPAPRPAPVAAQSAAVSTPEARSTAAVQQSVAAIEREPAPTPPAETAPSTMQWSSLDAALSESGKSGKPVMIDFNAEWCPPCRRLKHEVFEVPDHVRAIQTEVIPVSVVDRHREEGSNRPEVEELYRRFQIRGFPTLVVFSPATGRAVQTSGYGGADWTRDWIASAARSVR